MNRIQERTQNSRTFRQHTMPRILSNEDHDISEDDFDRNAFEDISFNRTNSRHPHTSVSDVQNPEMDQDSFETNMESAVRTIDVIRGFVGQQSQATRYRKPKRTKRGPASSSLLLRLFHLPEGAILPKLHTKRAQSIDPELRRLQTLGFGFSKSCWSNDRPKKRSISLAWNERQFDQFIRSECQRLSGSYQIYRITQQQKFHSLGRTPREIKDTGYKGKVVCVFHQRKTFCLG